MFVVKGLALFPLIFRDVYRSYALVSKIKRLRFGGTGILPVILSE